MPVGEIYLKLAVGLARDPKVRKLVRLGAPDAGLARDLYVQMCLYCKENLTDGFVPDEEIGVLVYPLPPDHGNQLAKQLGSVGLIKEVSNEDAQGWEVAAFVRRNGTRQDVERLSQVRADAGRKGGRPPGQRPAKASGNQIGKQNESRANPYTETETETTASAGTRGSLRALDDPHWPEFWDVWPKKVNKKTARKRWDAAMKAKVNPADILAGARRAVDHNRVRHGDDVQYLAGPDSWLYNERWNDVLPSSRGAAPNPEDKWNDHDDTGVSYDFGEDEDEDRWNRA
jgi:hypothetical protein